MHQYLLVQFQGYADINMGIGIVISGLGSVMIGDTILGFLKNKSILLQLLAVVAGCIIFRLIIAAVLAIGLDPNYLKLLTSIIVLLFVAIGNKKIKLL
jgi:putative ABC transport system permease protein